MRTSSALIVLCIATVLLGGCAVTSPGITVENRTPAASTAGGATPTVQVARATPTGATAAGELPLFMMDFDRVCETQVGYSGAAAYDASPGLHPVVLFADHGDPPTLIQSSATLPAGWTITEDMDFSNNSELAGVQLVACSRRVEATPNGKMCDFTSSDGDAPVTLELTDTVYELTVYAAVTGRQLGETNRLEAATTECPMFATFKEGDTQLLNYPTDDQYINALKEFVALS